MGDVVIPFARGAGGSGKYKGFGGAELSESEYNEILNKGCSWCAKKVYRNDALRFISFYEVLCMNCKSNTTILSYLDEFKQLGENDENYGRV